MKMSDVSDCYFMLWYTHTVVTLIQMHMVGHPMPAVYVVVYVAHTYIHIHPYIISMQCLMMPIYTVHTRWLFHST